MKKQLYFFLAIAYSTSIILTACGKKDDPAPAPTPKTKTQLIMQGAWSFDKIFQGTTDVSGFINACYKDNVVTFTSSTAGTIQNTITCSPTDNTPATFTWSWQSSETILALNAPLFPGGTGSFNLVNLTETALVVSQTANFGAPGDPQAYTFHYKH
jgi:hypothetical protein